MLTAAFPFTINGARGTMYRCEEPGDGIPLHSHLFNHITIATAGEIEVFTDDGVSLTLKPGDPPVEYKPGRRHGIRAKTAGAMFMNIGPDRQGDL